MSQTCTRCELPNPAHATACERCGSALQATDRTKRPGPLANLALVVAVLVSIAAASAALEPLRYSWQPSRDVGRGTRDDLMWLGPRPFDRRADSIVHRDYNLCERKAKAMHNLLAPQDISVLVDRRGGRVSIDGTPWEVDALDKFVELITRKQHQDKETVLAYIERSLEKSRTEQEYPLPKDRRKTLHRILQIEDVPVLVPTELGRTVEVTATAEDQETVQRVVQILRGNRRWCECSGLRRLLGLHASDCLPRARDAVLEATATLHGATLQTSVILRDGLEHLESTIEQLEVPSLPVETMHVLEPIDALPPSRDLRKPDHAPGGPGGD